MLPAEIRQQDNIKPGQEFEVERIEPGEYRLKRKTRRKMRGWSSSFWPVQSKAGSSHCLLPKRPTTSIFRTLSDLPR